MTRPPTPEPLRSSATVKLLQHKTSWWHLLLVRWIIWAYTRSRKSIITSSKYPHDLRDNLPTGRKWEAKVSVVDERISWTPEEQDRFETSKWTPLRMTVRSVKEPKRTLVYFHGGAFVSKMSAAHWPFVAELAGKLEAEVVVVAYGMIPWCTVHDVIPVLVALFSHVQREARAAGREVLLGGDSAGGGLAVALSCALADDQLAQPDQLILIAPWLDVSMSSPDIPYYEARDPWLSFPKLSFLGWLWGAKTLSPDEYSRQFALIPRYRTETEPGFTVPEEDREKLMHRYASPLWTDLSFLREQGVRITMNCGTADMAYANVAEWIKKCTKYSVDCTLISGPGCVHVYPLFATTPLGPIVSESVAAIDMIVQSVDAYTKK